MTKAPNHFIRFFVYPILALGFLIIFYFVALLASGYKIEYKNGSFKTKATGMIVLATKPGEAKVYIDNKLQKKETPMFSFMNLTIKGVSVGEHTVKVEKEGYETFEGVFSVSPKLVTWANYIILVPKGKSAESFRFAGNITSHIVSDDKTKMVVMIEDKETRYRTFWDVNLQTKQKKKFKEERIIPDEKITLFSVNNNKNRILLRRTSGNVENLEVIEIKDSGFVWNLTSLYKVNFDKLSFSPTESGIIYGLRNGDLYSLDYEKKNMSAVLASEVSSVFINSSGAYLVKKTEGNRGLWKLLPSGELSNVIKVIPASESYGFKHLKNKDGFLVFSGQDKELIFYEKDNQGNPISKSIARDINRFILSPNEERVILASDNGARVYDLEKGKYTEPIKNTKIESIDWINDDSNIIYSTEGSVRIITYLGHNNKKITDNLKNSPVYSIKSSPNVYIFRSKNDITDLLVYSFDF